MTNPSNAIDIYEKLGVAKDSSSQIVHKHFLKLAKSLLDKIKNGKDPAKCKTELRTLWIAHDILVDPGCRTDYDLRSLGIKTNDLDEEDSYNLIYGFGAENKPKRPSWRIGELLQATGILEQAELDIACDMHKAMPEMLFGRFLIKQELLNESQLQAVLIGQALIRAGHITLTQFINIMMQVNQSNRNIKEVLLESGYIKDPTILKLDNYS